MTPAQVIRAAIPGADDSLCEYILWERTPFPCGPIWARDIYAAASRWRRADVRGVRLCEFCDRIAETGLTCASCEAGLQRARARWDGETR